MEYANLLSKLALGKGFSTHFAFPVVDNARVARLFKLVERLVPPPWDKPTISRPVFVIGLPRTGSTWLQTLICSHPGLGYFTNWMHNFRDCIRGACAVARWLHLDARGERFIRDSVVNSLHGPSEGLGFWADCLGHDPRCLAHDDARLADLDPGDVRLLLERMSQALSNFPGHRRFFCKNPGFIAYFPLLAELFPDARFIHLVRDPRPTANSMVKLLMRCDEQLAFIKRSGKKMLMRLDRFIPYPRLPGLPGYVERFGADTIQTTARLWRDAALLVGERGGEMPHRLTVRFESVLADPRGTVARILEFCGLDPFPEDHETFAALCARTGRVEHVNAYAQYEEVADICRESMALLGYAAYEPPGRAHPVGKPMPGFGEVL